ncbi:Protein of unknown function (DUF3684) [Geosmithia morbida]|uniref:Sacsin/Nov domain-containing protein n=1 Tax=Geosmithia morbida TaxID=1094350 RepID=A0A9P4YQ68_9HYPO|nr:Protein of unknown function (DUF3684) [Geosmithia morbida]KAF4120552.1 Protein of unknown function (DUF3684) [Geosmithia morbida]
MDYSRLRAAALRDGEDEEAVTVDTRALIDKVLARYSGEWTTLRELIQNAADAQATTVSVKWETLPSTQVPMPSTTSRSELLKHVISHHTVCRLVVQNDGQPFTKTDWGRLKRIAEGNPDETKIGAFGVGFYSVFADCEEPFVSSGDEAMAFYWKGNALFTKKSHIPKDQATHHTTFVLDNRSATTPLPNLLSVSQFLATSLTFVALQRIEFWIDDYQILSLKKKTSPSAELHLPRDLEARTKEGIMKVIAAGRTSTQIDASFVNAIGWKPQTVNVAAKTPEAASSTEPSSLRSFFARLTTATSQSASKTKAQNEERTAQTTIAEDVTKMNTSTIFLQATTAEIRTNVTSSFASELERATKKPPPKSTKISILTSSYDGTNLSGPTGPGTAISKATDVFASVLPSKKPGGRVFIGFPTMQTTGAGMHISAPSTIPTVEREAIDLNARWVRTWNVELLRAAGIVARLAFANEMNDLNVEIKRSLDKHGKFSDENVKKFMPMASHILKTFYFGDSTPSGQVGQIIEEAFWTCFKKASIEVYSSQGVLQTSQVRLESSELTGFIDSIPVLPKEMIQDPFVRKLIDFGLISDITVTDIKRELEAKSLNKDQLIQFISWAGKKSLTGELDSGSRTSLLEVAVGTVDEDKGEIITLGSIANYLVSNKIPAHLPVPPTTIPFAFTINSTAAELQFLGWEPLEIVPWLRFLLESNSYRPEEESMTKSPKFAIQILTVLSKNWDTINANARRVVAELLEKQPVMPTKTGMKRPGEAFFPSVKLFDDLPTIEGCEKVKEKFLAAIGVRKTLDLETIFTRLLSPSSSEKSQQKWSHVELIKYLASVQNDIPKADFDKLRNSAICPAEAGPKGLEPTKGTEKLYRVSDLFEPKDTLRTLQLPIIQWPGPPGSFRPSSPEARFLTVLGLRPHPSAPELVEMMSSKDGALRTSAMTYFIANHHSNRYGAFDLSTCRKAIMPLQGSTQLVQPSACFTNERASALGFQILRKDLHDHATKFGVPRDPPMNECVNRLLANPPQSYGEAVSLFGYFAPRIGELGGVKAKLANAAIVPVTRSSLSREGEKTGTAVSHISPSRTYLGSSLTYGDIFDFVDFGQDANAFLFTCGAKNEPTKLEVAHMACKEPARLLSVLQSPEKYLGLLKSLAEESAALHRDKDLWRKMKTSGFLLAYKELAAPSKDESLIDLDEDEEAAPVRQYQLAPAGSIVVVDDIISFRLFKDHLLCAPEDDTLEKFYLSLGAQKLGSIVQEDVRIGPQTGRGKKADSLRKHVIERSKIFLYEYANYRRDSVKHDSKWLEKNLQVEMVTSVALRRTLQGQRQSHVEKRTAASAQASGAWVLYVADAGQPDMYQVGQALCQMLLDRPNQQAYLFFEPFLTLDLYGLRSRGYNVDRILRAKAAEARIAEDARRKALEEEQSKMKERERLWAQQAAAAGTTPESPAATAAAAGRSSDVARTPKQAEPVMPGSWDSPEDSNTDLADLAKRGKSLFTNFTRRLGLDTQGGGSGNNGGGSKILEQLEQSTGQTTRQPESSTSGTDAGGGSSGTRSQQSDDGRVTSPAAIQQNLLKAVNATRAHGSSSVFSQPEVNRVKEQATYCDQTPAQNITLAAEASNGVHVYVSRDMKADPSNFLATNIGAINMFASILGDVGEIYSLSRDVLHIYYDETGGSIAFNKGGSLFFNLRFYLQLHAQHVEGSRPREGRAEAATWWWVVFAHELAHNLVTTHNSDHSYYTESFIQEYFSKMMVKVSRWLQDRPASQQQQQQQQRQSTPSDGRGPPPPYSTSFS